MERTHLRPFRFGVLVAGAASRREWVDQVRRAEQLGYGIVLLSDHFGKGLGAMPALAVAAESTELRVGTLVLGNDFRHPAVLAKDTATLDLVSDGRLEVGIGAGWLEDDYTASGIAFDGAAPRVERLEEAVTVLHGLWSGEPFTHRGEHYAVDMAGRPRPVQRPHPPLLIGGSGRRMLCLAARRADIVGITATLGVTTRARFRETMVASGDALAERVAWIRDAAGDRSPELNVLVHEVDVTSQRTVAAERLGAGRGVGATQVLASPHVAVGTVAQICDDLVARRERYGISYVVFGGAHMETVAGVVARLAGT